MERRPAKGASVRPAARAGNLESGQVGQEQSRKVQRERRVPMVHGKLACLRPVLANMPSNMKEVTGLFEHVV